MIKYVVLKEKGKEVKFSIKKVNIRKNDLRNKEDKIKVCLPNGEEMLLKKDCTVTVCHSRTPNLADFTKNADILVCAVGKKHLITADMVKEGVVVLDAGINRVDGKIYGDVDFEEVKNKASFITPVPGGVGPMTITMLLYNTYLAGMNNE